MMKPALVFRGKVDRKIKGMPDALKAAMENAIKAWHRDILPEHFTRDGANKYKYEPRGSKYQKRKVRMTGQGDPLVYSGKTKREVTRMIQISGTSKSMKGKMSGSNRALNFSKRSNMPDMKAEIVTFTPREEGLLAKLVETDIAAFLAKLDSTETVRG